MAISRTVLLSQTLGAPTAATVTSSVTDPGPGNLLTVQVVTALTGGAPLPSSITGMGRTWTLVAQGTTGNTNVSQAVYRAMGTGSNGPLTINYAVAPTGGNVTVKVVSRSGVVTTGTNGADAIRQVAPVVVNAQTQITATLGALGGSGSNITEAHLAYNAGITNTMTPDGDAAKIGSDQNGAGSPAMQASAAFDPTPGTTIGYTTLNAGGKVLIAFEVAASAVSPTVANAGPDQANINAFDTVTLPFSASGGTGPYTYTPTAPAGSGITFSGSGSSRTFVAPADTVVRTYTISVIATDSLGQSSVADTVDVTVLPWNLWTMRGGVLVGRNRKTRRAGSLV